MRAPVAMLGVGCLLLVACTSEDGKGVGEAPGKAGAGVLDRAVATVGLARIAWSACDDVPPRREGEWECGRLEVALDPAAPDGPAITLALTRPVLVDGDDREPLLFNPGGPGGSGIEFVWAATPSMPTRLLERYYPVGWDPRGVDRSTPIDCGMPSDLFAGSLGERCADRTGALIEHIAAPANAHDMDAIRAALGEDRLDYVGYSYGTALGATYAQLFPDHVGRFVLDGAIDPDAAAPDNVAGQLGHPWYAADDSQSVERRFRALCDLAAGCAAGPHVGELIDRVRVEAGSLPVDRFDALWKVGSADLDATVRTAMYDASSWGLLGDALADADHGDGSTLAALSSYFAAGYPRRVRLDSNAGVAHQAVYCADFSALAPIEGCEDFPPAAEPLAVVTAVDVAEPILVVGTRFDPATPGRHAGELAARLADAVHVTWEGVGHTAFLSSPCLDRLVVRYLVDGVVPPDGAECPFVDGFSGDRDIARELFAVAPIVARTAIADVLAAEGEAGEVAACMASALDGQPHRVVTHLLLGVRSPEAVAARAVARHGC